MPDPASTHVKQTPGRRRPGPHAAARSANRKNYASENDAAAADSGFQPDFGLRQGSGAVAGTGRGGPTTPQKTPKNAGAARSPAPGAASGKANKRGAPASKNGVPPSPGPAKAAPGATVTAATAFAGATFHASPAPSSLPLPSFFTKSNSPGTPRAARPASGLGQQPSPPASDSELPSATATANAGGGGSGPAALAGAGARNPLFAAGGSRGGVAVPPVRDESPLDLLFRADRAEKERNRRASSAQLYGAPVGPYSPPLRQMQTVPDGANPNSYTFPRDVAQQQQQQQQQHPSSRRPGPTLRTSSSGISAAELDGTPGQPIGPAFATPFQERIRAARATDAKALSGSPGGGGLAGFRDLAPGAASLASGPGPTGVSGTDDRSEALKRFLFSKTGGAAASSSGGGAHMASAPTTPARYVPPPPPPPTANAAAAYQSIYGGAKPSASTATPNRAGYANPGPTTPGHLNNGGASTTIGGPASISAMEDSLRQILKLDSPFGAGAPSPGQPRRP